MSRKLTDLNLTVKKALPAAAGDNLTEPIDLGQDIGGDVENIEFEYSVPATTALVDTKILTAKVQDSADGVAFDDLDPLISTTVVGGSGNGSDAKTVRFRLPSTARRYIAIHQALESGGGNVTATIATLRVLG